MLVLVCALHVVARYALQLYDADVAGPLTYYTHLLFDVSVLVSKRRRRHLCGTLGLDALPLHYGHQNCLVLSSKPSPGMSEILYLNFPKRVL